MSRLRKWSPAPRLTLLVLILASSEDVMASLELQ